MEVAGIVLDTLQTLPTLVYLLPAVMLFRNGDFSALIAIVSYAIAPAVRYGMHAFAGVPQNRLEAAAMAGASSWQTFKWVRLPAAFPTLILGLNQTIMMALAMLVITALVGTRDLGQQVFIALSRAKVGEGIVAGLCVAAIALIADGILKALAQNRARAMGLSSHDGA
jgi:glycine betaine/proline transport system permease protein